MVLDKHLREIKTRLPKNLKHDPITLGRQSLNWALDATRTEGKPFNFERMRVLIQQQCSMIWVKKVALAMLDDLEHCFITLKQELEKAA